MFQLFIGADWNLIMAKAVAATTEGAQIYFTIFVFCVTLFCAELAVGIILTMLVAAMSIESPRLFSVLRHTFDLGESEQEEVTATLLDLNLKFKPHNKVFASVAADACDWESWEKSPLFSEGIETDDGIESITFNVPMENTNRE